MRVVDDEDLVDQHLISELRKEYGMTYNDFFMVLTDVDLRVKVWVPVWDGTVPFLKRETQESCHYFRSPPDVSVHSRETCFPCTTSTFKPRINSQHGGTWDSPVGKPRGKAS